MSFQLQTDDDDLFLERKQFDLKKRLGEIVVMANNLAVTTEDGFRQITALYAESKEWEKQIEFARKQANAPDQERINARNDKAKELLNPLREIQQIAKQKSGKYQELLEAAKKEEERRVQEVKELLDLDEMPYVAPIEKTQRTEGAILFTRLVKKFRVTNLASVPMKYLKINEDVVELDIKMGVTEIPGIEIYEEKVTQLKAR